MGTRLRAATGAVFLDPAARCGRLAAAGLSLLVAPGIPGRAAAAEPPPLFHWVLEADRFEGTELRSESRGGRAVGRSEREPEFAAEGGAIFDGANSIDVPGVRRSDLPERALTAEARVTLERGTRWGSFVGYYQDNGDYEKGWLLGYNEAAFVFMVSTGPKLVTLPSTTLFEPGVPYHLAGVFDGEAMHLYVNGRREASAPLPGRIDYPPEAFLTLGAYRDKDEFYRMEGTLAEVRLYDSALAAENIAAHALGGGGGRSAPLAFTVRPSLRFTAPDEAVVRWRANRPGRAAVAFGPTRQFGQVAEASAGEDGLFFTAVLTGLEPAALTYYKIGMDDGGGGRLLSPTYSADGAVNYSVPRLGGARPPPPAAPAGAAAGGELGAAAKAILDRTGVRKGMCLVLGMGTGGLALELARRSDLQVVGVSADPAGTASVRRELYRQGVYGPRLTALTVGDFHELPFNTCLFNLVVSEELLATGRLEMDGAEMHGVLAPGGGTLCLALPERLAGDGRAAALAAQLREAFPDVVEATGGGLHWLSARRGALPGSGSWTHQYGDAGNTAATSESLSGAASTGDLEVQWVGRPGADFGIDRNPRMPAPLAAGGRLFHQGMNRLVALDAYNGSILWGLEIPDLRRVNIPRDCGNWCADGDALYLVVKERAWALDAGTGELLRTFPLTRGHRGTHEWGFIARSGDLLLGSSVRRGGSYTQFWGGESWYDKHTGAAAEKVCSDDLFAYHAATGKGAWAYRKGAIINATIAAADGRVTFLEARHPDLAGREGGRTEGAALWEDQHLVSLHRDSGEVAWERPVDPVAGTVSVYLLNGSGRVILVTSNHGTKRYHLYAYDAADGRPLWQADNPWPDDHHSGHMQHPVILADSVFLQPFGYALDDGRILTEKVGKREGCHTYVGAGNALIYRGQNRQVSIWDRRDESVSTWSRLRPSCWLSVIPAGGMLLVPEGGGGCSCGGWIETSLTFAPKALRPSGP